MQKCTSGTQVNAWHPKEQSQNACGKPRLQLHPKHPQGSGLFYNSWNSSHILTYLACVLHNFTLLYVKFYWALSQNKEPHLPNCVYIHLTDTPSQPWQQLPQRKCQNTTAIHVWGNCAFFFNKGPKETHKAHGCQINNVTTVNYQNQSYGSDSHHSDCLFADMQTTNKKKIYIQQRLLQLETFIWISIPKDV